MILEPEDIQLFFRLYPALMNYVNQQLKIITSKDGVPARFSDIANQQRIQIRQGWLSQLNLTDSFVKTNPERFTEEELAIVHSWRHVIADQFYLVQHLKKHSLFLTSKEPDRLFGVVALSQPLQEIIGPEVPKLIGTALLPFKGRIIHDGLVSGFNIVFGPGIRQSLKENLATAKKREGVIVSLPVPDEALPPIPKETEPTKQRVPAKAEGAPSE
ncbi:MAG: hypothetical protein ACRCZF_02770, partial [Gemmataceae bacterium]